MFMPLWTQEYKMEIKFDPDKHTLQSELIDVVKLRLKEIEEEKAKQAAKDINPKQLDLFLR